MLSIGCKKGYEYTSAYIYETKFVHWGRGYFRLRVFYEFEYNDSTYKRDNFTEGLYKITGRKRYKEGDKVMIKFPKGKPEKSEVTRYKFKKKNCLALPPIFIQFPPFPPYPSGFSCQIYV